MELTTDYKIKDYSYYSHIRQDLRPFIPTGIKKVLDIGCSNGAFGKMLKNEFAVDEVWGVEPFSEAADKAAENIDHLLNLSVEESIKVLPENHFDCIFFNDVLEHLVDPYSVISEIKKKLKKQGYIFSSIPNIIHYKVIYSIIKNQDWKYENEGIMDKTHLRFFTKNSIRRMFEEAGFEVVLINGINPTDSKKLNLLRIIFGKRVEDFRFRQYATVAKLTIKG